jgi:hypothetical protein
LSCGQRRSPSVLLFSAPPAMRPFPPSLPKGDLRLAKANPRFLQSQEFIQKTDKSRRVRPRKRRDFIATLHRLVATLHRLVATLHRLVATLHRLVASLHRLVASLHRLVASLHRLVATLHRLVASLHRLVATLHRLVATLHRLVARRARFIAGGAEKKAARERVRLAGDFSAPLRSGRNDGKKGRMPLSAGQTR